MPVVIKPSQRFYEWFGQENMDELMNMMSAMDEAYRHEFRDLFAANFGTVRAEMSALRAEVESRLQRVEGRMDAFEQKVTGDLKGMKSELIGWMVGLWFVSVALAILTRAWSG